MAKGPRSLGIDYRSATLTHYGGAYLMHRFLTRLGVKASDLAALLTFSLHLY